MTANSARWNPSVTIPTSLATAHSNASFGISTAGRNGIASNDERPMETQVVDKDVRNEHYHVVGSLMALERLAKNTECMPCDTTSYRLLSLARETIKQAVISAMEYAAKNTTDSAGGNTDG